MTHPTPDPARPDRAAPLAGRHGACGTYRASWARAAARLALLLALVLAAAAGAPLYGPTPLAAQQIDGVALGPDGQPLADVPVALHRVGGGAGAFAGSTVTGDDGRFRFLIEDPDSALYFAAMRYDGRMYIGPAVTGGTADVEGYELRADPAAEAGAVASALSGGGAPGGMTGAAGAAPGAPAGAAGRTSGSGDTGALLIVAALALAAAGIFLATAPGYRRRRTRDTLTELATVENRLASDVEATERQRLEARRASLRGRLAPRG